MPVYRGVGAIAVAIAIAMGVVPATAGADAVTAPQVFVRLVDPNNATVGVTPWQPLGATLSSLGPYDIGVALHPPPRSTTDAQHNAFPGQTCTGGPTSTVSLTVNGAPTVRIAGTPLVPRTTRTAHGDNGPVMSTPEGTQGYKWRCARDPVVGPDGSVTGSATTSASDTIPGSATLAVKETDAFSGPGRWACSVQALSGDNGDNEFGTPWVTTPAVTVRGEFVRDQTHTVLQRLAHGRMRLTIPAIKIDAAGAAHGKDATRTCSWTCPRRPTSAPSRASGSWTPAHGRCADPHADRPLVRSTTLSARASRRSSWVAQSTV